MGSGASIPSDKHIVIVGAGYGGCELGLELLKSPNTNFTLIDCRDTFHHCLAAPRAIVEPGYAKKTMIPFAPVFGNHFKQDKVVAIKTEDRKVLLESGEQVTYDILVLATGSTAAFPARVAEHPRDEAVEMYDEVIEKVKKSQSIVVVGGGATGTEIATEIATDFPDKQVTLLHSRDALINNDLSQSFQTKLKGILRRMKINLILGEKVTNMAEITNDGPCTVRTDKGTTVTADLVFVAIGVKVNNTAYKDSLAGVMNEVGQLKVNQYLEVEGYTDIYAIGDCCNTDEPKLAYLAIEQARLLASNLKKKLNSKEQTAYKLDNKPVVNVISLGRNSGLGQMKSGWVMAEWMITRLKSKDLFVPKYWKNMKQKLPA